MQQVKDALERLEPIVKSKKTRSGAVADRCLALRGPLAAYASRTSVAVIDLEGRSARCVARFDVDVNITYLDVAIGVEGPVVIARNRGRACIWSGASGLRALAVRTGSRDRFAVGFSGGVSAWVLIEQNRALRGLALDGTEAFDVDLRSPLAFLAYRFVPLPGRRLAIVGREDSDSLDSIATVMIDELAQDPSAVQTALATRRPVGDRAPRLAIGPAPGDCAVVWRDPEIEEPLGPDDDAEELPDVWGFHGFYVRDLGSGELLARVPCRAAVPAAAPLLATPSVIAVERPGQIDIFDRRGVPIETINGRAVGLDRDGALRAARLGESGVLELVDIGA
ncbi:MAG: hypothetical protein H6708_20645 [Kofleriaceae bacterium]|nr:hypothetical protein [Myxococcales bacterium]MCB9562818.1 hypothetical protein [Kofleriaceae bacterium]